MITGRHPWPHERDLLYGESQGLAVDFADRRHYHSSTWDQRWVQNRTLGAVDVLNSPHVFFTQSGTSPKYVTGRTHPLEWSPHNLQLQSQTFDNAEWVTTSSSITANSTTAPDGTTTADTLIPAAASAVHYIDGGNMTAVAGQAYTASIYAKAAGYDFILLNMHNGGVDYGACFDLSDGTFFGYRTGGGSEDSNSITSVGDGWYRISITLNSAGVAGAIDLAILVANTGANAVGISSWTGDGSSGVYIWGAQFNRGYAPTSYIATTTAAKIGLPISYGEGLLVEPAATNLCLRSQEMGTSPWVQNDNNHVTATANSVAAPDGSTTAEMLTATAATNTHTWQQDISGLSTSTNYTFSVYLKQGTHRYVLLAPNDTLDSGKGILIDLGTGSILSTAITVGSDYTYVGSSIANIGNGWYRCSITVSWAAGGGTTARFMLDIRPDGSDTSWGASWLAAGTETIYVWGAQLETGTVATSYVPTVAASATRAADVPFVLTSAIGSFSATEGTFIAFGLSRAIDSNGSILVSVDDDTTNERIGIFFQPTFEGSLAVIDGGVAQAVSTGSALSTANTMSVNVSAKLAASWAANDFAVCLNGGTVAVDTSGTLPTVTDFTLGMRDKSGAIRHLNGLLQRVIYVPRAMSDAELQAKTT